MPLVIASPWTRGGWLNSQVFDHPDTIILPFGKSKGWYDFSVKVKGQERFEIRYAGRVETGEDSISDPYMSLTT